MHVQQRQDALDRVRRMLVERLELQREPDEIDPDTPLFGSGLALDSIDAVELVITLEQRFGVRVPDDLSGRADMRTVNALVDLVLAKEAAGGSG